jgi:hypothetical protein
VFTSRCGLMPYIKQITFRLLKVNWAHSGTNHTERSVAGELNRINWADSGTDHTERRVTCRWTTLTQQMAWQFVTYGFVWRTVWRNIGCERLKWLKLAVNSVQTQVWYYVCRNCDYYNVCTMLSDLSVCLHQRHLPDAPRHTSCPVRDATTATEP